MASVRLFIPLGASGLWQSDGQVIDGMGGDENLGSPPRRKRAATRA